MEHKSTEDKKETAGKYSTIKMTRKREVGHMFREDTLSSKYYRYIKTKSSWPMNEDVADHGGIFNLQFSPSGKMLVTACEKAAILVFDPFSRKLISKIMQAHNDSVNCICFLDERTFASGSDDCNIVLWDTRMLNKQVSKLEGHTSWVKSLEYNINARQLVTSGFDDTVRVWDINRYSDGQPRSKVILKDEHLTRMRLSPGGDKLIISTLGGSITVFHNLDLEKFQEDQNIRGFVNHLNSGQDTHKSYQNDRNYPEYIMEFPKPPWCISSLQVHPYCWCLMSRYSSMHLLLEYTTIHDIQAVPCDQLRKVKNRNVKRLSHFIEESNAAQGFIKEPDFSKDGRIIASPFGHGTRLLGFGADCRELCKCDQDSPVTSELHEVKYVLSHHHPVCTSKFSPTHMLLVTGCLGGRIAFHEPKLS